jgi:diguanylate cyclase (GGDEF)-like protein
MRNELFLSYFVDRFKDTPLSGAVARTCLSATLAAPAFGVWLLFFDASAWLAAAAALTAIVLTGCAVRALRAYRVLKAQADQLQRLTRALLATNSDCLKILGTDGRIMQVSEVGAELMEVSSSLELVGADWLGFWKGEHGIAARDALRRALAGEEATFFGSCATAQGNPKWWSSTLYPLRGNNGKVCAVLCPSRDVTQQTIAQHDALRSMTLLKDIETHIPVVFWSASADFQTIHHVSAGFETMWELPLAILQKNPAAWQASLFEDDLCSLRRMMAAMAHDGAPMQFEFRLKLVSGQPRWIRVSASPVMNAQGKVERIVSVCIDITEEKLRIAELDRIAHVDSLTGLANRRALVDHLSRRCVHGMPFSLLLADVDRFKVLNDTAGTVMADGLLRDIGQAIRQSVPVNTFVARPGGDEFAIVLAGAHGLDELTRIYEDVRRSVGKPHQLGNTTATITLSAGIATFPEHGSTPDALMSSADVAMYAAKNAGRDRHRIFGIRESAEIDKFQLERELRHALARREFVLHFQPIFAAQDREIAGVEALIRWQRLDQLVSPAIFVPLLEETGLIRDVGQWVFDESLRQLMDWRLSRTPDFSMSINVSAVQLADVNLPRRFAESVRRHGLSTRLITLEITESAVMERGGITQKILRHLQRLGFRVALDDFGTGYSSLSYLTRLRPDVLKLDRSLVADIDLDASARTVVIGIVALAKALNIRVVAEGVEREAQFGLLASMGCEMMQGFLLGRPESGRQVQDRFLNVLALS